MAKQTKADKNNENAEVRLANKLDPVLLQMMDIMHMSDWRITLKTLPYDHDKACLGTCVAASGSRRAVINIYSPPSESDSGALFELWGDEDPRVTLAHELAEAKYCNLFVEDLDNQEKERLMDDIANLVVLQLKGK